MSFKRNFNTLIIKSNNSKSELSYNNGIQLYNYDSKNKLISQGKIINSSNSFSKSFFNVNCDDSIYGVLYTQEHTLLYVYINEFSIYKTKLIELKDEKYTLVFPYIKKIGDKIHLFYYLVPKKERDKCILIHYFFNGSSWNKNIISEINYFVLSNFIVTWHNDIPSLFFFNRINKCEEVFMCTFNLDYLKWEEEVQITNSHKSKVYLSVIEPLKNHYHITFSENNDNKYYCSYVYAFIDNKKLSLKEHLTLAKTVACEFPSIAMINNKLYIQWIEFNELFTSCSKDYGYSWCSPKLFNSPKNNDFIRYDSRWTLPSNNTYLSNIFSYEKAYSPLGIPYNFFNVNATKA